MPTLVKQASCHLTILLFERTATPTLRIRLHLCGNGFGKDLRYLLLAGNDLCHQCDSRAEVNRVTHYAVWVRGSALTVRPYLWTPAPVPRSSASRCVPLSFDPALEAFPGAESNFSRPMAGDTKTREFEKVAT
jgi:hypothetical protein